MKATNDRIICKLAYMPESTSGKIILAQTTIDNGKTKLNIGKVLSVGPGMTLRTGEFIPNCVKEGDVVVWEQFGAIEFEVVGKDIVCTRSEDVGCILEESEWKGRYLFDDNEIQEHQNKILKERVEFENKIKEAQEKQVYMYIYRCTLNANCENRWVEFELPRGEHACKTCGSEMKEKGSAMVIVTGEKVRG